MYEKTLYLHKIIYIILYNIDRNRGISEKYYILKKNNSLLN